jgi:gluconolactonase
MNRVIAFLVISTALSAGDARLRSGVPQGKPDAVVDLATDEGARLVQGNWRYSDTRIVETDFLAPGSDGQPGKRPTKTYDYAPHAGNIEFDDSRWEVISPSSLEDRRSTGRLCFNWYRINITVPERVNGFDARNSVAVFETSLDDYARFGWTASCPVTSGSPADP